MKINLSLIFLLCFHAVFGQRQYSVKDEMSKESIPFVKVYPNVGQPFLCDLDGLFTVTNPDITSVRLNYSGYLDTTVQLSEILGSELFMQVRSQKIDEITVVAGENPAHRIVDLVIANRKRNNPMDNDAFRYKSYSKVIADADSSGLTKALDSLKIESQRKDSLKQDSIAQLNLGSSAMDTSLSDTVQKDSSRFTADQFFAQSYLFMIESSSIRTFVPPARDNEEIVAYKASGFSDPMFATFAKNLQSFSFYENQFNIGQKTFINPIATGGTRRYLFILQDTTFSGNDTIFHISFRPRKDKNFDGMSGMLYINTDGYAVEKVIASPAGTDLAFEVKVIQEYQKIDGKKWFPNKLSSEFSFPFLQLSIGEIPIIVVGKSNTYIESVELNPENLKRNFLNNANVVIKEEAGTKKDEEWMDLRKYELTEREQGTYRIWDTISKEGNLDKRLYGLKVLLDGKIPLKYVTSDISRILNYNDYEGLRLGLGTETSKLLFEPATIGGYFAYGFRDKAWKYGGNLDLHLFPKKQLKLSLVYQQDVLERGGRQYDKALTSTYSSRRMRNFFISQMDGEQLAKATLSAYVSANCHLGFFGSYNRINFNDGYQFVRSNDPGNPLSEMDIAFVGTEFSWRIREKVMIVGDKYVPISQTKFPVLYFKGEQALSDFQQSTSSFSRAYAEIKQRIILRGVGSVQYTISAGKTFGEAPLTFAQTVLNSAVLRTSFSYSVPNTFETVLSNKFYMQDQVSLFTRFNFNKWKSLSKKFQPQISLHHAIGFGNIMPTTSHLFVPSYSGMEKGYFEGGLIINDLIGSKLFSMGAGIFYNYGAYSQPVAHKNIFGKLSFGMIIE